MVKSHIIKSKEVLEGSAAIAQTICSIGPGVIASYPITPQTHIVEKLAELVASGDLNSQYVPVDSEFSAASVVYGSVATGVRSYSASSSQGLLLMTEVIFNMAGTRLPAVFTAVNRSLSPPINIQVDHQDTMTLRDSGIIQIYVESIQEAVDTHIQIFKIAENKEVLLPAMVCMDGWIISHAYEPVTLWDDQEIRNFIPPFDPIYKLDPKYPLTYGTLADDDIVTEFKFMLNEALNKSKTVIKNVAKDFQNIFGNYHGGLVEEYNTNDAEIIFVAMGSIVGTLKLAIDELRSKGHKVGVLKIRSFRPFPHEEIKRILSNAELAIVLDRSFSCSAGGILGTEVKCVLFNYKTPKVINYIVGIGGRETYPKNIEDLFKKSIKAYESNNIADEAIFYNINWELI